MKMESYWTMLMNRSPNARVVLVGTGHFFNVCDMTAGNKIDMTDMRQVSEEEGVQLSKRYCML